MYSKLPLSWADGLSRRTFLQAAGIGAAGVALGGRASFGGTLPISEVSRMVFDVTYRTKVMDLPSDAEQVNVWMPLPPSDYGQTISDLGIESSVPYEITRDPVHGNRMAHIVTGPQPFEIAATYRVERRRVGAEPARLDPQGSERFLTLTPRVRVTDEVDEFASSVIGDASEPLEAGRRVFDGISELLTYDKTIAGCGTGDTAWIMRHKRGKCDDFHALFMAVMVSREIPVRWEQGFPLAAPGEGGAATGTLAGDCTGAHCWASFYDPSAGWVPVDISEGDKVETGGDFYFGNLSPNRFKVSEGRNVTLEPAQGGMPLNTFAYAYAEADGIPLIYGPNYENLISYTVTEVDRD